METAKELISETVSLEPINEVTVTGTKEREEQKPETDNSQSGNTGGGQKNSGSGQNTVTDVSGNAVSYTKMLSGKGTAYCDTGLTASGHQAGYNYVAVNPNVIPYGTRLYVRSTDGAYERYCVASVTGGALMSGNVLIDLWFPTNEQCSAFGVRTVEVYFI